MRPATGARPFVGVQPADLVQDRAQVSPVDVSHGDEQHPVGFSNRMDRDDVRVLERRGELRFAQEPLAEPGVACKLGKHDLQRHPAVERDVERRVHDAGRAVTDRRLYPVSGKCLPVPQLGHTNSVAHGRDAVKDAEGSEDDRNGAAVGAPGGPVT